MFMFLYFQEITNKSVILIPVGACDDGAHSQNEKIDRRNYIQGVSRNLIQYMLYCNIIGQISLTNKLKKFFRQNCWLHTCMKLVN